MKANDFLRGLIYGVGGVVLVGGLTGCSDKDDQPSISQPNKIELTTEQKQILSGIETFSYELFNTMSRQLPEQNVVVSPWGVVGLMSMMNCDNRGEDAKNINDILHQESYDDIQAEINETNRYLCSSMSTLTKKVDLTFNRSYWLKDTYIAAPFISNTLSDYYDVKLMRFSEEDNLKVLFDKWIASVTDGVLKSTQIPIPDDTVWLLAEVMNFQGKWKSQFKVADTQPGTFYNADGSESTVPMMKQTSFVRFIDREGIIAVSMDFADGEYAMQFIMPSGNGDIETLARNINNTTLTYWDMSEVNLTIPRFDMSCVYNLKNALMEMGLRTGEGNMPSSKHIDMTQECRTIVDEAGAKAVSVSVALGDGCPQTFTYTFDRPFIYIIKENSTGVIIQMGKVCSL